MWQHKKTTIVAAFGHHGKSKLLYILSQKKNEMFVGQTKWEFEYNTEIHIHIHIYAHTHKPTNNFKYNCSRTVSQKTDLNLPKCFFSYTITFSRVLAKIQYKISVIYRNKHTYILLSLQTYKKRQHFFAFMLLFLQYFCALNVKTTRRVDCLFGWLFVGLLVKGESLVQHFSFLFFRFLQLLLFIISCCCM